MKYFSQALKDAWRHWSVLAAAMVCSLAVAALWGLNIAALFPITGEYHTAAAVLLWIAVALTWVSGAQYLLDGRGAATRLGHRVPA